MQAAEDFDVCPVCRESECESSIPEIEPECGIPVPKLRKTISTMYYNHIDDVDPSVEPIWDDLQDVLINAVRNPDWCMWLMNQMMSVYNKDEMTKMYTDVERVFAIESPQEFDVYFFLHETDCEDDICDDCIEEAA